MGGSNFGWQSRQSLQKLLWGPMGQRCLCSYALAPGHHTPFGRAVSRSLREPALLGRTPETGLLWGVAFSCSMLLPRGAACSPDLCHLTLLPLPWDSRPPLCSVDKVQSQVPGGQAHAPSPPLSLALQAGPQDILGGAQASSCCWEPGEWWEPGPPHLLLSFVFHWKYFLWV